MQDLCGQLTDLSHKINGSDHTDTLELANNLMALCDIVAALANKVDRVESAALSAANTASCLANGMKPD